MKFSPPTTNDISRIADWVELYVLFSKSRISKAKAFSILQENNSHFEEEDVDSIITELERRLILYGENRPFKIEGNIISPSFNWQKIPSHALCLYYSTYGVGKTGKGSKRDLGTQLFEKISKHYLEKSLSFQGQIFGFPNFKSFKLQLDTFASKINAKRIDDPNSKDKDRGVDLVLFKKFDETRDNCFLIFIQCAAGKNWNEKKLASIDSYRRFVAFGNKVAVPGLALTQIIDISDWKNACDDYGIIIDRARLFRMLAENKYIIPENLKKEIIDWCKTILN